MVVNPASSRVDVDRTLFIRRVLKAVLQVREGHRIGFNRSKRSAKVFMGIG